LILTGFIGLAGVSSLLIWEQSDTVNIQVTVTNHALPANSQSFRLEGATYKGNTADGDAYVLFADVATEDADQQGVIEMLAPRAKLDQPDQQSLTIRSNEGVYYADDEELQLTGRVVIVQPDTGYTLYTDAARAWLDAGIVESTDDVHGYGPDSMITAKGMVISRPDNNVIFTGKSALVIEESQ
jgi:LPS export ABC transporter protein LptC